MPVEILAPIKEIKTGLDTNIESVVDSLESAVPKLPGMEGAMGTLATPPQIPGLPPLPGTEGAKSAQDAGSNVYERENAAAEQGTPRPIAGKPRYEKSY